MPVNPISAPKNDGRDVPAAASEPR
jgi:hypothetical protein